MNARLAIAGSLALLASLGAAWPVHARADESPAQAILSAAEQATRAHFTLPGSRLVLQAMPLDPRQQPASCTLPLQAHLPDSLRPLPSVSVPVRCPQQPGGWTVRVLVKLQVFRNVLIARRPLLRGDGLRASDVQVESRDIARLGYGYVGNLDQVAGRTLSQNLPAGSVLTPAALGGRNLVRAGDHVSVVAMLGSIEVRAQGVALGSGDDGARLRVRNDSSGRVIDAMVNGPGTVLALP